MTFEQIIVGIVGILFTVIGSRILVKLAKMDKKQDERHKESVKLEGILCIHRMRSGDLQLETARAVKEGKSNGGLSSAIIKFEDAHCKYEEFISTQAGARLAENK